MTLQRSLNKSQEDEENCVEIASLQSDKLISEVRSGFLFLSLSDTLNLMIYTDECTLLSVAPNIHVDAVDLTSPKRVSCTQVT